MPRADLYRRHDWVYPRDDWRDKLAGPLGSDDEVELAGWIEKGRPLVVARRRDGDAPDLLRLGLALPGKRRIAAVLSAEAIGLRRRPPFLLDVIEFGATFWPEAMRELATLIGRAAPETRVFGSFAWQFFAADPASVYVTPASDVDLLLTLTPGRQRAGLLALLAGFMDRFLAPRLDGEIALTGGDFISWREYAARPNKILVKGASHVSLRPIEEIDLLLSARAA
jgi:phosphoribosyl-dephospho-CoA transferase